MTLTNFLEGPYRNFWLENKLMKVYVRKSVRYIGKTVHQCLDVATVEVKKEAQRGKGLFTDWLDNAERLASAYGYHAVYVESILEPRLVKFLVRKGYTVLPLTCPPSAYKLCTAIRREIEQDNV